MPGWTTATENAVLNAWLRNTAPTLPATLHMGLYTVLPDDDGAGGTEVSAGGYARQTIAFAAASGGAASNSGTITFSAATPASWGTVVGFGLFTASTGGTPILTGTINPTLGVSVGAAVVFAPGTVTVTAD